MKFTSLITIIFLSWVSTWCVPGNSVLLISSPAANIINGQTPDDIDDSPCSEAELIEYVGKAKKVINAKWQPVKGFEDRNAVAVFTVRQNGNIENAQITESSGSQAADQSALDALKASSPLSPLPKGAPETIDIRYVFAWHVTHKYDRSPNSASALAADQKHLPNQH